MDQKLLKGKPVTEAVYNRVSQNLAYLKEQGVQPRLTVVLVGEDPASQVYVRRKGKACEKLGILSDTVVLPADISEHHLLDKIKTLNADSRNHGILVQLPLPAHINEENVIMTVAPQKDVDCFHPQNVGLLVSGNPYMLPCTPAGIVEILKYYQVETQSRHVEVVGRSNIDGKPMVNLLLQKNTSANATVTVVHSRTQHISDHIRRADIVIAAIGQPNFIKKEQLKEGSVVIDVGINRIDADNEKGYKLVGDVDFDDVYDTVSKITPVPGGVGPMTIAMLMQNTLTAAAAQNNIKLPSE